VGERLTSTVVQRRGQRREGCRIGNKGRPICEDGLVGAVEDDKRKKRIVKGMGK